jgi:hypothetical protein
MNRKLWGCPVCYWISSAGALGAGTSGAGIISAQINYAGPYFLVPPVLYSTDPPPPSTTGTGEPWLNAKECHIFLRLPTLRAPGRSSFLLSEAGWRAWLKAGQGEPWLNLLSLTN